MTADAASLLTAAGIRLGLALTDRETAIRQAGALLVEIGAVEPAYVDAMLEREGKMSSFVGEGFAIPHGTDESRTFIRRPALVFLQFPEGIDWDGQQARAVIGIAARSDEHLAVMSKLAMILLDPDAAEQLRSTEDVDDIVALLANDDTTQDESS